MEYVGSRLVFGFDSFRISGMRIAIFPQPLQANSEVVLRLGNGHFLVEEASYHSRLCFEFTDSRKGNEKTQMLPVRVAVPNFMMSLTELKSRLQGASVVFVENIHGSSQIYMHVDR
jgi:hypothetical protein